MPDLSQSCLWPVERGCSQQEPEARMNTLDLISVGRQRDTGALGRWIPRGDPNPVSELKVVSMTEARLRLALISRPSIQAGLSYTALNSEIRAR